MTEKIELTQEELQNVALFLAAHRKLWNTCQKIIIDNTKHSIDDMCLTFWVWQEYLLGTNEFMPTLNKLADMADIDALEDIIMKTINNVKKAMKQKGD